MRVAAVGMTMAVVSVVLSSSAVGAASKGGLASGEEWPMFMGGFTHAGQSQAVGPSSPDFSWALNPNRTGHPAGFYDYGNSPVVGSHGTIYLVQTPGDPPFARTRVEAISPSTHKTLWTWLVSGYGLAGGAISDTPAVAPDGVVYVATNVGKGPLYAIKNGKTLWTRNGFYYEEVPTIGPDETLYVDNDKKGLEALNPQNGAVYWKLAGASGVPALSPDGTTLYVPAGGDLDALSAGPTGGQLAWTYHIQAPVGGNIESAPAVGPDGTIYVATGATSGNTPGDIEAVNPDGTLKWAYVSNGTFETTPAVTSAGQVVAGNDVGTVAAVQQSDGTLAWSYSAPGTYGTNGFDNSSAASDANGNIYIQNQFSVFALSPEGSLLWTVNQSSQGASPAMDDSGTLYINGGDQSLIAYESNG
jgi:outer membrane protein assembly factor BamB